MNKQNDLEKSLDLYLLFLRTYDLLVREVEARLKEVELSQAKYGLLRYLSLEETLSLSELSKMMLRGSSNLTTLCRRMEQAGLVEVVVAKDRREKRLRLTPLGSELREMILPVHRQHLQELFAPFNNEDKETFKTLLLRLLNGSQSEK